MAGFTRIIVVACVLIGAVVVHAQHHYVVDQPFAQKFPTHYVAPHHIQKTVLSSSPYYDLHHTPPIDPYTKYAFGYAAHDPYTGGFHDRVEEKHGPVIKGKYSVVDPSGARTVSYATDPVLGFQAIVDEGPKPVRDLQKLPYKLF